MKKGDKAIMELTEKVSYEDLLRNLEGDFMEGNDIRQFDSWGDNTMSSFSQTDEDKLKYMKQKVLKQIEVSANKRLWVKGVLAAGLAFFFLITALSPFGQKTLAEIIDRLYFIPGAGQASQNSGEDVYILKKPVNYQGDIGRITIHSITKRSDVVALYVTGDIFFDSNKISMKANGTEYISNNCFVGVGENNTAVYNFIIPDENENFTIDINHKYSIPVTLTKAESFEDYEDLGPTCIKEDFGLTLVPQKLDHKLQFDLIQHNTNNGEVWLYGSCDKEGKDTTKIKVYDNYGRPYPVDYPASHVGTQSVFTFTPLSDSVSYTVEIPEVTLKYNLDSKFTLPMPAQGETQINQTIDLHGFKLMITKIIRKDNLVTIYVDTNYHSDSPDNICYFLVDMDKMSLDYYHWIMNDQVTTEGIEFYINPDKKKLNIYFKELYTVLKGPWNFKLSDNND